MTEAILYVREVKVASSVTLGHAAALKETSTKNPIQRVDCKVLSIPGGFSSFTPDNLFLGHIPKRLVLVLVDTAASNGSYASNPYNFKHQSLTQVGVYVDGEQTKSTTWDPVMGLFSYISSPFSFQFNTSRCSLILSISWLAPAL